MFRESRIVSAFMIVILTFSSAVWAAGPEFVGNLRTSGIVMANSIPLPDGGTVRSGDLITTGPGGLAVILHSTRGRLEVRSDSQARLGNGNVRLERGVVASGGVAVESEGFAIRPQGNKQAWFVVARRDGRLTVAAYQGTVLIMSRQAPPVVVNEGSLAQQPPEEKQAVDQKAPDEQEAQKPGPQKTSSGSKEPAAKGCWTIGGLSHASSVALVAALGLGAAAASAAIALFENNNPSPSR